MSAPKVVLIGAGPGRPDLITLRGLRALREADAILYDALLPRDFLQQLDLPLDGKTVEWLGGRSPRPDQDEINRRLVEWAARGWTVARLKNGDPFVFGRACEEIAELERHGILWEVVPGLTSGVAGAALAGLPVTCRGTGRSFALATARTEGGGTVGMLAAADTLILYMGVSVLDEVAASLLREGWGGETPSVALERAAMPWERRIAAPLKDIARVCREAGVQSPAVLVAGAAARNALRSRRILFTGLDPSNFLTLGDLLHWPALTVAEAPTARADFAAALGPLREGAFDWVAFTSRKGTAAFFALLEEAALDARVLGASRLIACGRGTAGTLRERGLIADAVPPEGGGAGILQGLGEAKGARVLLVQGTHALAWLSATLEDRGARVTRLGLHRVMPHPELGRPLPAHDIVYFSSPSGVAAWMKAYGADGFRAEVWCMGETTKAALAALGLRAEIVDPFRGPRGPAGTPR